MMRTATTPEQAFLENSPIISPVNMINCTLTRTNAIVDCLHTLLEHPECVTNETITAALWQVSGNLDQIRKITNKWHEAEIDSRQLPGNVISTMKCKV